MRCVKKIGGVECGALKESVIHDVNSTNYEIKNCSHEFLEGETRELLEEKLNIAVKAIEKAKADLIRLEERRDKVRMQHGVVFIEPIWVTVIYDLKEALEAIDSLF